MPYPLPSRSRRRGQALLLAVLIMIFAALLSASFIAIIAVNLNQTARQTDKNRARASAQAGLDYVNRQLSFSNEADRWRPTIPAAAEVGYSIYYSPLDRAQGWADNFAKFPDPRNQSASNGSPQFLAKVEKIPFALASTHPEFSRAGSLKITVVGLSPDDPTAYHTLTAYKGGYQQAPIAQAMRVVSNWDFQNNTVPVAQVKAGFTYNTANKEVVLEKIKGEFPPGGFSVIFSGPNTPARATRGFAVATYDKSDPANPKLILASSPTAAAEIPTAGERVELAANIGAPEGIDYDNNPATPPTAFTTANLPQISDGTVTGGVKVNGGLWWAGNIIADQLRSARQASQTSLPLGSLQASGMVAKDASSSVTLSSAEVGTTVSLLNSSQPTFPVNASTWAGATTTKYDLVDDGWNRLRGVPNASERTVANFQPPTLDSKENLERYRNLTRFSKPYDDGNPLTPALPASASLYGQGEGIYIDNVEDKEKMGTGSYTRREMTQSELVQMWMSKSTTPAFFERTGDTTTTTPIAHSLEEQRLRGWVGPDEFRARGVEIELTDDYDPTTAGNQIGLFITRDARSDNTALKTTASLGPDADKTWKNQVGVAETGVYRRGFPWPTNGVIFAEGNVRIQGVVTATPPRSLTVVSMNNIYIEDSLDAGTKKVLLLARKNVVMNPTRVLGRPDAQTVASGAQTVPTGVTTLTVTNAFNFKRGDFVHASPVKGYVTADPTSDTVIPINATVGGTVADLAPVVTPNSVPKTISATSVTPIRNISFSPIYAAEDTVQRRLNLPNPAPANLRLAFNHQANRVNALRVGVTVTSGTVTDIQLSNKGVFVTPPAATAPYLDHNATVLAQGDKKIRVQYTQPTAGVDDFPGVVPTNGTAPATPTTQADATDATRNLAAISAAMNATNHNDPGPPIDWNYNTSVLTPAYSTLPFFYLAGVGNRLDFPFTPATIPLERRPNIRTTVNDIPLAMSVGVFANGAPATLSNERWNAALGTPRYDIANQFGFSPTYLDAGNPNEDILTTDQSFYQTDVVKSTLDSRQITSGFSGGSNSFFFRRSDALPTLVAPDDYPEYRLQGLKLENVALVSNTSTVNTIGPARTFTVNAFVYAQTGSWFVIPGGLFDERLKFDAATSITFLDLDGDNAPDAGEFIIDGGIGYPDLNRNGVVDSAERYSMERYSRYNYQINFTGAIAENQTALINDAGTGAIAVKGAVASWMDSWATTNVIASDPTPITRDRIRYIFDPSVVMGNLEDNPTTTGVDETDRGFHLPQTLDLFTIS